MDLAQSILQELITLQKKNEELARVIGKLEHESDVIIQQFEHKIEELQKGLKHEQDDKSRAARRYDEEIRDLEGTKDALINEIAEVRETYQSRATLQDEKIRSLNQTLEGREREYTEFRVVMERDIGDLKEKIDDLQKKLADNVETSQKEITSLRSQNQAISDTLDSEREQFKEIILLKDNEIRISKDSLHSTTLRLFETEDREKTREEQSQSTIDHLNHILHSERQIRNRELKERDEQIRQYEADLTAAKESIGRISEQYGMEISRLQEENRHLSLSHAELVQEYDEKIRFDSEQYAREKDTLIYTIEQLQEEILSTKTIHEDELSIREKDADSLRLRISELNSLYLKEQTEQMKVTDEYTFRVSSLESEKEQLTEKLGQSRDKNTALSVMLHDSEIKSEQVLRTLNDTIENLQTGFDEANRIHQIEIKKGRESLDQALLEYDQISAAKHEQEDYYRTEITGLHDEISEQQTRMKAREDELYKEVALRDNQISVISTNNEALRAEIDRVRLQYLRLQETIRAEKDESVHALYRDITSLEEQLTGKETEISDLTKKVLRLDAENTRLLQALSQKTSQISSAIPPLRPQKEAEINTDTPALIPDPRRREIFLLAADLDDPSRAPEAAEKLTGMGSSIVDMLIPLLHTGSIQRRVWVAVVLYEINDNRATLPLMKLLETPKIHFRELIWEAKNQYRTRMRMGTGPAHEGAGIRAGPQWPGSVL